MNLLSCHVSLHSMHSTSVYGLKCSLLRGLRVKALATKQASNLALSSNCFWFPFNFSCTTSFPSLLLCSICFPLPSIFFLKKILKHGKDLINGCWVASTITWRSTSAGTDEPLLCVWSLGITWIIKRKSEKWIVCMEPQAWMVLRRQRRV